MEKNYVVSFPGTHPTPTACDRFNIHLFVRAFRSEKGMSSTEMSPTRASLAVESAAELPLMPTWPAPVSVSTSSCLLRFNVCAIFSVFLVGLQFHVFPTPSEFSHSASGQ